MDEKTKQISGNIYNKVSELQNYTYHFWKEHILFSWLWWIGLGLFLFPWVIWILIRKKDSSCRILFSGLMTLILCSWFDFIGVELGLWYYPVIVFPTIPSFEIWDFTLLPVFVMFLIQFYPNKNRLFIASVFSGVSAFIGEPLFHWAGFYEPKDWKYIYSFPIYMIIYLIAHFVSRRKSFEPLD